MLEESIFGFRYADTSKENWFNYLQTVETLIGRRRLIWVCTVASYSFRGLPSSVGYIRQKLYLVGIAENSNTLSD